jgi:hypothetical protein
MKMSRHLTPAARAAKEIRGYLKAKGIKASVRSKNFSMGDSIDVEFFDESPGTLKKVVSDLDKYEYGTFDGMTDTQGFKNQDFDGPQTKYLHISNKPSEATRQRIWDKIRAQFTSFKHAPEEQEKAHLFFDDIQGYNGSELIYRVFRGSITGMQWDGFEKRKSAPVKDSATKSETIIIKIHKSGSKRELPAPQVTRWKP